MYMKKTKGIFVPAHTMKRYGGAELQLQSFITLTPDGDECSTLWTSCLFPGTIPLVSTA